MTATTARRGASPLQGWEVSNRLRADGHKPGHHTFGNAVSEILWSRKHSRHMFHTQAATPPGCRRRPPIARVRLFEATRARLIGNGTEEAQGRGSGPELDDVGLVTALYLTACS